MTVWNGTAGRPPVAALAGLAAAFLFVSGCGSGNGPQPSPSQPASEAASLGAAPPTAGFYPLEQGNQWHYDRSLTTRIVPADGSTPPPPEVFQSLKDSEISGTQELFGRTYVIERHVMTDELEPDHQSFEWIRYRQDPAGLFEADVSINDPPESGSSSRDTAPLAGRAPTVDGPGSRVLPRFVAASSSPALREAWGRLEEKRHQILSVLRGATGRPPGGVQSQELTRLAYPLRVGATWNIRVDPIQYSSTVEMSEVLALPPGRSQAWRIRIGIPGQLGPHDRITYWWGRCGYLKSSIHLEMDFSSPGGPIQGTMVLDDEELLQSLTLVGAGGCGISD